MKVCSKGHINADSANFCKDCGEAFGYIQTRVTGGYPPPTRQKMTFGKAISTCFSKYATFKGRAGLAEYWYFVLFEILIFIGVSLIGTLIGAAVSGGREDATIGGMAIGMAICALIFMIPSWSVTTRRLHDSGKSGVWIFINYITLGIIGIVVFVFTLMPGDPNPNEYGDLPDSY